MPSLTVASPSRKPGVVSQCPRCNGTAREGVGMMRRPCGCCAGKGKVCVVEEQPACYVAVSGEDVLEAAASLDELVGLMTTVLAALDGDVCVFRLQQGYGPRAVAVLTKDAEGAVVPRWL
jgi:hypothetical protein